VPSTERYFNPRWHQWHSIKLVLQDTGGMKQGNRLETLINKIKLSALLAPLSPFNYDHRRKACQSAGTGSINTFLDW